MKKLFVVGCPRSGTTILQQALHRHSQIVFPPETSFLFLLGFPRRDQKAHWSRVVQDLGIDLPFPAGGIGSVRSARALYEQMASLYLQRSARPDVVYFGEKSPEHQLRLPVLRAMFPDAKVLLIYRDGRDVALSLARVPWLFGDLELSFALWLHYYRIQKEVIQWHWPDLCLVQYEQLVADPEGELRRILAFLGLAYEPQVATGQGDDRVIAEREWTWKARSLEKISAARAGIWQKEMTDHQLAILERWGGTALRELGYELATGGTQPLPWHFYPRLYARMLCWVLTQRRYKVLKEACRQGLRSVAQCVCRSPLPGSVRERANRTLLLHS